MALSARKMAVTTRVTAVGPLPPHQEAQFVLAAEIPPLIGDSVKSFDVG